MNPSGGRGIPEPESPACGCCLHWAIWNPKSSVPRSLLPSLRVQWTHNLVLGFGIVVIPKP